MNADHFSWLPSQLIENAGSLHLQASKIGSSLFGGHFLSWRTGISIEFKEHRDYAEGDDLSKLDWKVLARADKAMIRTFSDEKSLEVIFCIDTSKSMNYHSSKKQKEKNENHAKLTKFEYARLLTAVLSFMFFRNNDSFGAFELQADLLPLIELTHKPQRFLQLCASLDTIEPQNVTQFDRLLSLKNLLPKKENQHYRICFLLTDFLDGPEDFHQIFTFLSNNFQQCFIFHIADNDELSFPFEGQIQFIGLENDQKIDLNASVVKKLYKEEIESFFHNLEKETQKFGLHYFRYSTENPIEKTLIHFLQSWMMRHRK